MVGYSSLGPIILMNGVGYDLKNGCQIWYTHSDSLENI